MQLPTVGLVAAVVIGPMTSVSDKSVMLRWGLSLRRVERGNCGGAPFCSGPSLETCGLLFSVNWAVPRTCIGGVPKQAMEKAAPVRGGGAQEHVGQSPGTASAGGAIFGAPISVFFWEFHPFSGNQWDKIPGIFILLSTQIVYIM